MNLRRKESMRVKTFTYLILLLLSGHILADENPISVLLKVYSETPDPKLSSCSLSYASHAPSQIKVKNDIIKSNLYEFGVVTTEAGFKDISLVGLLDKDYLKSLKTSDFEKFKAINLEGQAWLLSGHPAPELRQIALEHNTVTKEFHLESMDSLESYLSKDAETDIMKAPDQPLNHFVEDLAKATVVQESSKPSLAQSTALAASYSLFNTISTVKSINRILKWMNPRVVWIGMFRAGVSLEDTLLKVTGDKVYWRAANSLAKKILSRIKSKDVEGKLFDDVFNSFLEQGLSKREAYEKSWDLIGLYATRGASIGETLFHLSPELKPLAISMSTIGTGMNVLDSHFFTVGKNYSYPPNLNVSFDNGKPYHFWMAAYLSRRLSVEVGNKESASIATYLAQLGYQMKSATFGRDPARAFEIDAFAPANNKIRLDLTYAAAGARFGPLSIDEMTNKTYDLDMGIKTMLDGSKPLEPISVEDAKKKWEGAGVDGYFRWKKIFNPDVLLKVFN
jgi:hypothetical protein